MCLLYRNRRLDGRMCLVVQQFKIFELKIKNIFHQGIYLHFRQWKRCPAQLQLRLFKMIIV